MTQFPPTAVACARRAAAALILAGGVVAASAAWATSIGPGFDLFKTDPLTTFVDLGPGIGPVSLKGVPGGPGDSDTVVERKDPLPTLPVGGSGTIDIELVALALVSVSPVDLGGTDFDLEVFSGSILSEPANPLGSMTITHGDPNGGTFSSILPVNAKLVFTEVGNPANVILQPFSDVFTANGIWSHTPCTFIAGRPPAGGFFPGCDPRTDKKALTFEQALLATHGVFPAPEPASLAIFGLGLAGMGFMRRRRAA